MAVKCKPVGAVLEEGGGRLTDLCHAPPRMKTLMNQLAGKANRARGEVQARERARFP